MNDANAKNIHIARWLLRIGLAFVYAYAVIEEIVMPANFIKYIPNSFQQTVPLHAFLIIFGIIETVLALWLLSGKKTAYAGLLSFCLMVVIIFSNLAFFSVLFRNVAIAFASLALFALDSNTNKTTLSRRLL